MTLTIVAEEQGEYTGTSAKDAKFFIGSLSSPPRLEVRFIRTNSSGEEAYLGRLAKTTEEVESLIEDSLAWLDESTDS